MTNLKIAAAAVALTLLITPMASAEGLWLHVQVDERGDNASNVRVNLPLSIVEKALPMIPREALHHGENALEQADLSLSDLRELWAELKNAPDTTFVTVDGSDEKVRVSKESGYMLVTVDEDGGESNVNVRVPLAVVDALLSGDGETLDIQAAIRALVAHGEGELVTVAEEGSTVRVWVDAIAEAR